MISKTEQRINSIIYRVGKALKKENKLLMRSHTFNKESMNGEYSYNAKLILSAGMLDNNEKEINGEIHNFKYCLCYGDDISHTEAKMYALKIENALLLNIK